MLKDLLSLKDLSPKEIEDILKLTAELKKKKAKYSAALKGKTLALIFQKPSNRTRVSFEVGMFQLGGYTIYLRPDEINLGIRESIQDVAKTLSRYIDCIVIRTFEHNNVIELAKYSDKPVVNGLSDFSHPCQALADIFTVKEKFKKLKKLTLAYVGDGNNVCNSLLFACAKTGMNMNVASPEGFKPEAAVMEDAAKFAAGSGSKIIVTSSPQEAVKNADVIYTDVWTSMGQEKEAEERKKIFKPYQVNNGLVALAKKHCLVMHCLPAHRGQEITDDVMDSSNSVVFDQAENRMHVQKAVLIKLIKGK